jgi:hypothetical protein
MIGFRAAVLIALLAIPSGVFAAGVVEGPGVGAPLGGLVTPQAPTQPYQPPLTGFGGPQPPIEEPRARECHGHCDHSKAGCADIGNSCPSYCFVPGCD